MQLEAFKATPSGNESYLISEKQSGDDDSPTYVKLADAAKYIGIAQTSLQKNLAGKVYRNEVSGTVYGVIDHPIAVCDGTAMLNGPDKSKVYVSMKYLRMRRKLRDSSPRRKIIPAWHVEKAVNDSDFSTVEGKFVSEFDARGKLSARGLYITSNEDPITVYPDDPHSTVVVPVSLVWNGLSQMPRRKRTAEQYAHDLTRGRADNCSHVFVDHLYVIGIIDEELFVKAQSGDLARYSNGHLLIRPSHLANLAGGVTELKRMLSKEFPAEKYSDKHIPRIVRERADALSLMRKAFGSKDGMSEAVRRFIGVSQSSTDRSSNSDL